MIPKHRLFPRLVLGFAVLGLVLGLGLAQRGGAPGGGQPESLRFRFMGPAVGNRISAAAGVPGVP